MYHLTENFFTRLSEHVLIDLSHRCPLECPRCQRQEHYTNLGKPVIGYDLPLDTIEKVISQCKSICFGGQLSDPIHHPKFTEILSMCYRNRVRAKIQTASSFKPESWYVKAWQSNPNAIWQFGIDGLPEQSHLYRKNQDGVKLFKMMCKSKNYLNTTPVWQSIVFRYNENDIDKVKDIAFEKGVKLVIMYSHRWLSGKDPLRPINKEYWLKRK